MGISALVLLKEGVIFVAFTRLYVRSNCSIDLGHTDAAICIRDRCARWCTGAVLVLGETGSESEHHHMVGGVSIIIWWEECRSDLFGFPIAG